MRREVGTFLFAGVLVLATTAPTGAQELRSGVEERQSTAPWKKVFERKVTLPAGTMLAVRLIDRVSSDKNQTGDRFEATLDTPVMIDGAVAADKGASVVGRVVRARKAGRMTNPSELVLDLVELVCPTGRVPIETDPVEQSGESSSHAGDAVAIGSTAALGTALGAIFGGGMGAAIGAAAGGAVGAGGTLGAKGKPTAVKSEAVLMFRLRTAATLAVFDRNEKQESRPVGR
jgi:hypothetical protein